MFLPRTAPKKGKQQKRGFQTKTLGQYHPHQLSFGDSKRILTVLNLKFQTKENKCIWIYSPLHVVLRGAGGLPSIPWELLASSRWWFWVIDLSGSWDQQVKVILGHQRRWRRFVLLMRGNFPLCFLSQHSNLNGSPNVEAHKASWLP